MTSPMELTRAERLAQLMFSGQLHDPAYSYMAKSKRYLRQPVCVTGVPEDYTDDELRILARFTQQVAAGYRQRNWTHVPLPPKPVPQRRQQPGLLALIEGKTPVLRADKNAPVLHTAHQNVIYPWNAMISVGKDAETDGWRLREGSTFTVLTKTLGEAVALVYRSMLLKTGDWMCTCDLVPQQVRATKSPDAGHASFDPEGRQLAVRKPRLNFGTRRKPEEPKCWLHGRDNPLPLSRIRLLAETRAELETFIALYRQAYPHDLQRTNSG